MSKRDLRLPREGLTQPEDTPSPSDLDDVEGHGLPTTAPPAFSRSGQPGHGGENIPSPIDDEDDVEGHRRA